MSDIIISALVRALEQAGLWIIPMIFISMLMHRAVSALESQMRRAFGFRLYMILLGWPGTMLHELSHALVGVFFFHKIDKIRFFQLSSPDGKAGFVRQRYNLKSVFQRSGNFFIAIAPVFSGAAVICLAGLLLMPDVLPKMPQVGFGVIAFGKGMAGFFSGMLNRLIRAGGYPTWRYVVFIYLLISAGSGMRLSRADLRGALPGVVILAGLILACNLAAGFLGLTYLTSAPGVSGVMVFVYALMLTSLILNLGLAAVFYVIAKARRIV